MTRESAACVDTGLTTAEAEARLAKTGPNELPRDGAVPTWKILARQFASPLVLLMIAAAAVSGVLGEVADAIAIGAIVLLNGLVGFLQERRAERAVLALRSLTAPRARVIRDGQQIVVPAAVVVPGDLLLVEAGDLVAADATLLEAHALSANEAPLTGESLPVDKQLGSEPVRVFLGTAITSGTGRGVVDATGLATELGKIATMLETASSGPTPLQRRLAQVSRVLLVASGGLVVVVAILELARRAPLFDVFLSAVALAVAAVPEGLPAIVTIALAIGVRRMAARNALVRKLPAVETLGSTTVICTDKTGTLTTGVMTVRELWGPDHAQVLDAAAACCDAELGDDPRTGTGDPTEIAILVEAAQRGISRSEIEARRSRVDVWPFDPARKRMAILRADGVRYVKGAVEVLVERSTSGTEGAVHAAAQMAARGLRVLAVAVGAGREDTGLRMLGLIGIADPPRAEVIDAVRAARAAGIRTVMITGDHPITAHAIARELGIEGPIHARATPEDKLRIVRELKARDEIVAMTGDGVNDAPALREAHVGIAMGKAGTEVAREVSDIVLADDNYATIVAAIHEGRGIFDNIRKALVYLLIGNVAELCVMLAASCIGLPLPLLPLQLLWINLVTDGLPALALVMDPPEEDVMRRPPRAAAEPILGRPELRRVVIVGVAEAALALGVFAWALHERDLGAARSLAFAVLVFSELFRSFAARSTTRPVWEVGLLSNLLLLAVVALSLVAQLALYQLAPMQRLFGVEALSLREWAVVVGLGLLPACGLEAWKLIRRAGASAAHPPRVNASPAQSGSR